MSNARYDRIRLHRIIEIRRIRSSASGNPRFSVTAVQVDGSEWTFKTGTDSMAAYVIENPEYRDVPVWVDLNSHGHIVNVKPER